MKGWLICLLARKATVEEAVGMLLDFSWLQYIQTPDITKEELMVKLGKDHSLVKDIALENPIITYDEFKITKSHHVDM